MAIVLALLDASLERAGATIGDLTGPAIARFYAACPAARDDFERLGLGKRQRLEAEMIELAVYCLMTWPERPGEIRMVLETSVPHHHETLHVGVGVYRALLDSVIDTIADPIPPDGGAERDNLRRLRDALMTEIDRAETLILPDRDARPVSPSQIA